MQRPIYYEALRIDFGPQSMDFINTQYSFGKKLQFVLMHILNHKINEDPKCTVAYCIYLSIKMVAPIRVYSNFHKNNINHKSCRILIIVNATIPLHEAQHISRSSASSEAVSENRNATENVSWKRKRGKSCITSKMHILGKHGGLIQHQELNRCVCKATKPNYM